MRRLRTLEELREEAERVGLGVLSDDELRFLLRYYEHAAAFAEQLSSVDVSNEEPATVFKSASPS